MNNVNSGSQSTPIENKQSNSAGTVDTRTTKRNSGLFSFLKWFKNPTTSKESINSESSSSSSSSSTSSRSSLNSSRSVESINSTNSTGTVASFSFVTPDAYRNHHVTEKSIAPGPETDTYKARLRQREKIREKDKNITLRKKYNLFFNRDTLLSKPVVEEDNSKSLPLMTKKTVEEESDRLHRRTASESSKIRKAGAYCHVKGKRKAPQPPNNSSRENTFSLRRKKRTAPAPPSEKAERNDKIMEQRLSGKPQTDVNVICNDSLKLDHGILKPAKEEQQLQQHALQIDTTLSPNSTRSSYIEAPVSPRPWYKRSNNVAATSASAKKDKQNEPAEKLPDVQYARNNELNIEETKIEKKKDDKRKSGISFLTNISELDREATELLKKEKTSSDVILSEIPAFMRPKQEQISNNNSRMDTLVAPNKRKSAKDLIAKFNAITNNVSKVTVNPFQFKDKRDYFGGKASKLQQQDAKKSTVNIKKSQNEIAQGNPLMKSESASVLKSTKSETKETPKVDKKSWYCPKCYLENEYWRIICHVCSTIKPYFDDLSTPPNAKNLSNASGSKENIKSAVMIHQEKSQIQLQSSDFSERNLERSKTQIGFSAFARYNTNNNSQNTNSKKAVLSNEEQDSTTTETKKEEREKLIKMLIEMKNSLPKRKNNNSSGNKENKRTSVIEEGLEVLENENKTKNVVINGDANKLGRNEAKEAQKKPATEKENQNVVTRSTIEEVKKDFGNSVILNKVKAEVKETKNNNIINDYPVGLLKITEEAKKDLVKIEKEINRNSDIVTKNEKKVAVKAQDVASKIIKKDILQKKEPEINAKNKNNSESDKLQVNKIDKDKPIIMKEEAKQMISKTKPDSVSLSEILIDKQTSENNNKNNQREVILVTQKTIYENIKVSKNEVQKPVKVSSSAQTSAVVRKTPSVTGAIKKDGSFELMRPKDFADIYNEKMGKASTSGEHLYANFGAANNEMSVFVNIPKRFSDLKNSIGVTDALTNNTDTLEINRLLRRLETAIAKGELTDAAVFARELAQLKVNCSVIRQRENKSKPKKGTEFTVNMFVEDRLSHRGPFPIQVNPDQSVGELKKQVEKDFEIPINVQRWILGKELATDDKPTLKDYHVTTNGSPVFLYLVAPNKDPKHPIDTMKEQAENATKLEVAIEEKSNATKNEILSTKNIRTDQNIKIEVKKSENLLKEDKDIVKPSTSQQAQATKKTKNAKDVESIAVSIIEQSNLDRGINAVSYPKSSTVEEDVDDYDCKTLKPQRNKDWECRMCTLLNPPTSNICAVCATVRQNEQSPPTRPVKRKAPQPKANNESKALHLQLLDLDNNDLVANTEAFECMVCLLDIGAGDGVTLRECLHQFCKECLAYTVEFTDDAEIKCPYRDDQYSCDIALQDREIKALVAPNIYEQYLARSMTQVENKIEKSFHCKTPDCKGWCIFEDNVNEFRCPVCRKQNCLTCQAIHTGMNCKQYQEKMNAESDVDENAKRTREMLQEMVNKGEALTCPACQVILMKKWGCDWVRCSMCKTEICWVTRGPRWGPAGKGDTSGGCKCGVNGIKCHAQCNYCH